MAKKKLPQEIRAYTHDGAERTNNPPVGLASARTDPDMPAQRYEHDPHVDPFLSWAGKSDRTSFDVPTVSLHVHETIDPRTIIEQVQKPASVQPSLFEPFEYPRPFREAIDFYRHKDDWTNRMVAGDSLMVMNSLLQKESMTGKVQMIYMDPPYGIKYGSNFQPFVNSRDVVDGKASHLTAEPEAIRAFRDTWELGIHSYLSHLRDRLLLAKDLLAESGSLFVQMGVDNMPRMSMLLDEVFGVENRMGVITYVTGGSSAVQTIPNVADYILWYARDKKQAKYRQLYETLSRPEIIKLFNWDAYLELRDGTSRKLTPEERSDPDHHIPQGARLYQRVKITSQGHSTTGRSEPFVYNGDTYRCRKNSQWSVSHEALERLASLNRLDGRGGLRRKVYEEEMPGRRLANVWRKQSFASNKQYVVQTASKVIRRCLLMTTDPGDLVLDPTCGSGTTAYVAEQWGRRWITCDTSRVAITIARNRIMTAHYPYYSLQHPGSGVAGGFVCKSVQKHTAKTLGYDLPPREIILHDQPFVDQKRVRVTGPFTVEAVPAPTVLSVTNALDGQSGGTGAPTAESKSAKSAPSQSDWREDLYKSGIRGKAGERISFARMEPLDGPRWLQAIGETISRDGHKPQKVAVSFGPDYAPMEQKQVERAVEEAIGQFIKPDILVFAAFQFDPEAQKDIDEASVPGLTLLRAQMHHDLLTGDLKKKSAGNDVFWLIGQPDVSVGPAGHDDDGDWVVEVKGFDYYNPAKNDVESGGQHDIACWMLDTDYNGRSLYPRQVFFPQGGTKQGWGKLQKALRAELDMDRVKIYGGTRSLSFRTGDHQRIAVKIVDTRGVESLKIVDIPAGP
ncbi:MAG: site-specific DNA-methyltransferase [Bacteroidetes bacterium]|nr:site-specific DNA-methyltransferase [Bacteroidota bacterium]